MNTPTSPTGWVVWIVGALIAGGLLKVLYDLYVNRGERKLKRGQNDVLLIKTINDVAREALERAEDVTERFNTFRDELNGRLRRHDRWDQRVLAQLEAATGETVEPPPPLYADDHL